MKTSQKIKAILFPFGTNWFRSEQVTLFWSMRYKWKVSWGLLGKIFLPYEKRERYREICNLLCLPPVFLLWTSLCDDVFSAAVTAIFNHKGMVANNRGWQSRKRGPGSVITSLSHRTQPTTTYPKKFC